MTSRRYMRRRARGIGDAPAALTRDAALKLVRERQSAALDMIETRLRARCPANTTSVLEDLLDQGRLQFLVEDFEYAAERVQSGGLLPERAVDMADKALSFVEDRAESYVERVAGFNPALMQRCVLKKPFKMRTRLSKPGPSKAFERETQELCGGWGGRKAAPPNDCDDIEYAVRPTWSGVDIFAEVGGRRGDEVGTIQLQIGVGDNLEVHYAKANPNFAACNVGRTLYEVARQYGCQNGLKLASDKTRSPFSECFWRRQVLKGRAVCKAEAGSGRVFAIDTRDEYSDAQQADRAMAPYRSEIMQSFLRRDTWTCGRYHMKDACPPPDDTSLRGLKKNDVAKLVAQIPSVDEMRKRGKRKPKRKVKR